MADEKKPSGKSEKIKPDDLSVGGTRPSRKAEQIYRDSLMKMNTAELESELHARAYLLKATIPGPTLRTSRRCVVIKDEFERRGNLARYEEAADSA